MGFCAACKNESPKGNYIKSASQVKAFSENFPTPENQWVCRKCLINQFKKLSAEKKKKHIAWQTSVEEKLSENKQEISTVKTQVNQNTEKVEKLEANSKRIDNQKQQITNLEKRTTKVEEKVFPTKKPPRTIYDFNTIYHWIGWPIFLISTGYVVKKIRRVRKRRTETKNYLVEIQAIFKEWQLNMYASTGGYVVGFYLIKEAIDKWVNPRISGWLITQKLITLAVVSLIIGIGFYLDGIITSSLKTPLQRLSIKIENADIDEKVKKSLLSKTQKVNELFKETLKRFGLLAVVGILTKLIEIFWNKHFLTLLSYAVPIAGALKIIWEVDKTLKELKLKK